MAALSDTAGLLFKIKADSSDAIADLVKTQTAVKGLGSTAEATGAKFAGLAGPLAIAVAGIAAVGTAAIATAHSLYVLTVQSAEYGSKLYDASVKTGLSAKAISALKLAADSSGSSLDAISGSVSKFNVLLGQANQGNEKARATLEQYGITAKTTDEALNQAIETINGMASADQKAVAAKDLFKDKTGQLIPVIDQMGGSLSEYIKIAEKLGVTLTQADLAASDKLGDSLTTLGQQAEVTKVIFSTGLMPAVSNAVDQIGGAIVRNQDAIRVWGQVVGETVNGAVFVIQQAAVLIPQALNLISGGLFNLGTSFMSMADRARTAAGIVLSVISPVLGALALVGRFLPDQHQGAAGFAAGPPAVPKLPGGGGGGGGGGKTAAPKDDAEAERKKEIAAEEKANQQRLASYKAYLAQEEASLKVNKSLELADEQEYLEKSAALKVKALLFEKQLLQNEQNTLRLNDEERHDRDVKIQILETEIGTEKLKLSQATIEQTKKEVDAEAKKHEQEKKHLQEIKEIKWQHFHDELLRQLHIKRLLREEEESRSVAGLAAAAGGGFIGDIKDKIDADGNVISKGLGVIGSAFQQLKQIGLEAFGALASGIGQMVQNWVLLGNAGGQTFRKLAAQIIASVAQQAAIMAIMCLAYAAMATTVIGQTMLGGTPVQFLKAAALFGAVAVAASLAGRVVAGGAFQQQTGGGGAGGSGGEQGAGLQNSFSTGFSGFGQQITQVHTRTNAVLGQLEQAVHGFVNKFGTASPGDVVMAGAAEAPFSVRDAVFTAIDHDGAGSTGALARLTGQAR